MKKKMKKELKKKKRRKRRRMELRKFSLLTLWRKKPLKTPQFEGLLSQRLISRLKLTLTSLIGKTPNSQSHLLLFPSLNMISVIWSETLSASRISPVIRRLLRGQSELWLKQQELWLALKHEMVTSVRRSNLGKRSHDLTPRKIFFPNLKSHEFFCQVELANWLLPVHSCCPSWLEIRAIFRYYRKLS